MTDPQNHQAIHPLDPPAVKAANQALYAKHPEMVGKALDPNDPAEAGMRREWMALYASAGGSVEPQSNEASASKVEEAKAKANRQFSTSPPGSPIQACPGAKVSAPHPVPVRSQAVPCELVSLAITCQHHGRTPSSEGILMVVPDSTASLGDTITGKIKMKESCGKHAAWSVGGASSSQGIGNSFSFRAQTGSATLSGLLSLKSVSPETYRVSASACAGGARSYEVRAYPPHKITFKIDPMEPFKAIEDWLKEHLPVGGEEKGEGKKEEKKESGKYERGIDLERPNGSLEYEGAWKEDEKSWKAFYEQSWIGGLDPLISLKCYTQIYPPSLVPAWLGKWVKAGLFLKAAITTKLQVKCKSTYWPHDGKTERGESTISGSGELTGELSLEVKLLCSEIVEGSLSGETGGEIECESVIGEEPEVKIKGKFSGVKGKASLKAAWGLVEIGREYQIVQESKEKELGTYSLSKKKEA